jgi:putative endonuclease
MFYVYILTNQSQTLYIGMTRDLPARLQAHRDGLVPGFTSRYRLTRLIYVEVFDRASDAVTRERQLKGWKRSRKLELIQSQNPGWKDLAGDLKAAD